MIYILVLYLKIKFIERISVNFLYNAKETQNQLTKCQNLSKFNFELKINSSMQN